MSNETQLEKASRIYAQTRDSNGSKKAAKDTVYDNIPGFRELVAPGQPLAPHWGNAVQRYEAGRKPRANGVPGVPAPNNQPAPDNFQSAVALTLWLFERWVERNKPIQPGDCFFYSPKQCADLFQLVTGRTVTTTGFVNEFTPSQADTSRLRKAGWQFETIDNSHEHYTVRITAVPAPPPPPPAPAAYTADMVDNIVRAAVEDAVRRILANGANTGNGPTHDTQRTLFN